MVLSIIPKQIAVSDKTRQHTSSRTVLKMEDKILEAISLITPQFPTLTLTRHIGFKSPKMEGELSETNPARVERRVDKFSLQ